MDAVEYRLHHACGLFTTLDVRECMDVGRYRQSGRFAGKLGSSLIDSGDEFDELRTGRCTYV